MTSLPPVDQNAGVLRSDVDPQNGHVLFQSDLNLVLGLFQDDLLRSRFESVHLQTEPVYFVKRHVFQRGRSPQGRACLVDRNPGSRGVADHAQ